MADAFDEVGFEFVSYIIYFCAFFGITAACFTNLIVSRILLHFLAVFVSPCDVFTELTKVVVSAS